ncbi:MAG: translation initiation factor IF-2 subunit beta [Thermoplasma acidophilum]|nr:translation initiation factor IF-2 subunit beta [Thermoplasma acidophilum]
MTDDYEKLLEKAKNVLSSSTKNIDRLKIPDPEIIREGKATIIRNFQDIVDIINRDPEHIIKFLTREFGTNIVQNGRRLIINRKLTLEELLDKMNEYINTYVRCYECGSLDTEIQKSGRISLLVCKACGAQHPIHSVRETKDDETVEEGKEYVVEITEVGSSGEGRTNYKGYTIFVPGAKKGETVKVRIKKVKNDVAIGEIIERSKQDKK